MNNNEGKVYTDDQYSTYTESMQVMHFLEQFVQAHQAYSSFLDQQYLQFRKGKVSKTVIKTYNQNQLLHNKKIVVIGKVLDEYIKYIQKHRRDVLQQQYMTLLHLRNLIESQIERNICIIQKVYDNIQENLHQVQIESARIARKNIIFESESAYLLDIKY